MVSSISIQPLGNNGSLREKSSQGSQRVPNLVHRRLLKVSPPPPPTEHVVSRQVQSSKSVEFNALQDDVQILDEVILMYDERLKLLFQQEEQAIGSAKFSNIRTIQNTILIRARTLKDRAEKRVQMSALVSPELRVELQNKIHTDIRDAELNLELHDLCGQKEAALIQLQVLCNAEREKEIAESKNRCTEMLSRVFINRFNGIVLDAAVWQQAETNGQSMNEERFMSDHMNAFLSQHDQNITPEAREHFALCARKLADAVEIAYIANSDQAIREMEKRISALQSGDSLLLRGQSDKHALLYEIRREGDSYIFTIINTGDDEILDHERNVQKEERVEPGCKHKEFTYEHKAYRCDRHALNSDFLKSILPRETSNTPAKTLLVQIDSSLRAHGASRAPGRRHHPQGGKTCALKAPSSYVKGALVPPEEVLIQKFGREKGHALYLELKALHLEFKVFRTREMIEEMKKFKADPVSNGVLREAYQENEIKLERLDGAAQGIYEKRIRKAKKARQEAQAAQMV